MLVNSNKVIPKSIKVAKLNNNSFKKKLTFSRIRKESIERLFQRNIALSTSERLEAKEKSKEIWQVETRRLKSRIN